jgi:hypothetical protein
MRAIWCAPMFLLFACANGCYATVNEQPKWHGQPVQARTLEDGSMHIIMTVPTGGYALGILNVQHRGDRGNVFLRLQKPTGDFVTQVVTELSVSVPAADLEGSKEVRVWIVRDGEENRLAFTTTRR